MCPLAYQKWQSIDVTIYPSDSAQHGEYQEAILRCDWALERCAVYGQHPIDKATFRQGDNTGYPAEKRRYEGNGQAFFLDFISA